MQEKEKWIRCYHNKPLLFQHQFLIVIENSTLLKYKTNRIKIVGSKSHIKTNTATINRVVIIIGIRFMNPWW
jgi:hypothetical protein